MGVLEDQKQLVNPLLENGLLGWAITTKNKDELMQVCEILAPDDFLSKANQFIFSGVADMSRKGKLADLVSVSDLMRTAKTGVTPDDLVNRIQGMTVFGFNQAIRAAEIIRDLSLKRQAVHLFEGQISAATNDKTLTAENLLAESQSKILTLADNLKDDRPVTLSGIMAEAEIQTAEYAKLGRLGYRTGFDRLDSAIGGLIPGHVVLVGAYTGTGKCHSVNTPILMADGSIKAVQDIRVGDKIMGDDSTSRNVLALGRGREEMFEIVPVKGESFIVNRSHILSLKNTLTRNVINISVDEYLKRSAGFKRLHKLYRVGVDFPNRNDLTVDPYFLGAWLGDGNAHQVAITSPDPEIVSAVKEEAQRWGENMAVRQDGDRCPTYVISNGVNNFSPLRAAFKSLDLLNNKHIPHSYKTASRSQRLELLAGLLDTDGHYSSGFEYSSVNEQLSKDIVFLARSLGFAAYIHPRQASLKRQGMPVYHVTDYRVHISGELSLIPMRIPRKKAPKRMQKKDVLVTGLTVRSLGEGDYYGFTLDGNHLYLLGDFTVTHNTFWTIQVILNVLKQGGKVALFSTEMDRVSTYLRILGNVAGVPALKLMRGDLSAAESDRKSQAIRLLKEYEGNIYIYDNAYTVDQIRLKCKRQELSAGLDVFFLDFVQNLRGADSIYERMSTAAVELQQLCKEVNACGVLMSQVSNESGKIANNDVIQYKGAGELAAIADAGLWLNKSDTPGKLQLLVRKSRHGVSGVESYLDIDYQMGGRMQDGLPPVKDTAESL